MPLPRTAPLRSLSRVRPTRNVPHSRPWPRAQQQRRTYADAKESAKAAKDTIKGATDGVKGSDMPWLAGAILVTVPASYFVAKSGPMTNPFTHPLPGDHYHGEHGEHDDDDEEEHEDGEGEGDGEESDDGKQSEGGGSDEESSSSDDADDDTPATSDDDDSDPAPGEEKRTSQPGKTIPGASTSQQSEELPSGPDGQTRLLMPSAKGGNKKRVESSKGIVQGQSENDDDDTSTSASSSEEGSIGDVKDGSKSAAAGQVKGQQKGVSNTDTKHSTDQMKNPEASKKPEGVPETAKIQGTVDPRR